jgi:ABC-type transport system involved in cytochrome bd biosynthesis fused ATPase/permease subunit
MKPDDFNDPGTEAADRKDNRTAIVVAISAAVVVGIASAILMATAGHAVSNVTPKPSHSMVQVQTATNPAES